MLKEIWGVITTLATIQKTQDDTTKEIDKINARMHTLSQHVAYLMGRMDGASQSSDGGARHVDNDIRLLPPRPSDD